MKIINVVGARPDFVKIAPLIAAFKTRGIEQELVHTGQHYDAQMSQVFFDDLKLPRPDIDLSIGSASHAIMTGEIMIHFDEVLHDERPDCVVVVGDVNSTLACALTAAKLNIPVAHIEAGLRCFEHRLPEETNRKLTDHLSNWLFTHSPEADENLIREGIPKTAIHRVGNIMIDTLFAFRKEAEQSDIHARLEVEKGHYAVLTMHRPYNVDQEEPLKRLLEALREIAGLLPIVFPIHPRAKKQLQKFGLMEQIQSTPGLIAVEPIGYIDFLALTSHSKMVLTDSGGIQEETTAFGIPCLTMRPNTERPICVNVGTSTIVGNDPVRLVSEARLIMAGEGKVGRIPDLWDGRTAARIVDIIAGPK